MLCMFLKTLYTSSNVIHVSTNVIQVSTNIINASANDMYISASDYLECIPNLENRRNEQSNLCNSPWRPKRQWDVEALRYSLHKWWRHRQTWRMASSGMLRRVALVRTDVSQECSASIIRVTRIGELGITLAVISNRRTLYFFAACVGC
jgi:hypothetical protein